MYTLIASTLGSLGLLLGLNLTHYPITIRGLEVEFGTFC